MKKRSMTAAEFDAVKPFLNISEERIKAARMALVDQMTLQAVGDIFGWSRQAVGFCVNAVWEKFAAYQESLTAQVGSDLPEGYERVTLVAPKELIPGFYAQIAAAVAAKGSAEESAQEKKKTRARKKPDA
jgi:hypothetical protein